MGDNIRKAGINDTYIETTNNELLTVRDAMRTLNLIVSELETGIRPKMVLMKGSRMVAVILSIDEYARLNLEKE